MNILIVGGGAIGTLYGAYFSKVAESVTFLVRREDHARDVNDNGVRVVDADDNAENFKAKATLSVQESAPFDLIFFSTKVYDLENAFEKARPCITPDTILMSIQNGVQHFDLLKAAFPDNPCIGGISYSGLTKLNNIDVLNTGPFRTVIGDNDGALDEVLQKVETLFEQADMNVVVQVPVKQAMWEKQVLTSMQQAIGAMTGYQFQQLLASDHCKIIARQLCDEVMAVARAEGANLDDGTYDRVLKNWGNKPTHRPSMAIDFDKHNTTEVHMANGYVAELAEKHGLDAPVNKAMYHLIKAIEEGRPEKGYKA